MSNAMVSSLLQIVKLVLSSTLYETGYVVVKAKVGTNF